MNKKREILCNKYKHGFILDKLLELGEKLDAANTPEGDRYMLVSEEFHDLIKNFDTESPFAS